MLRKNNKILIYDRDTLDLKFEISIAVDIVIKTNRDTFTDTCSIVLPNNIKDNSNVVDKILIGDVIEVYLGYFPNLKKEFSGYIVRVGKDSPLEIDCEDESFVFKRTSLNAKTYKNTTISEVISDLYNGETNIVDANIGDLRIEENATLIKVLDLFKSKYGILSYFQDGVLNINQNIISDEKDNLYLISVQDNVPQGSSTLKFQDNESNAVISHGVSVQRNGTKIELYATYKDNSIGNEIVVSEIKPLGTLNTLKIPDLNKESLTELIKRRLPRLYYTGVSGDISIFGEPSIKHGQAIRLKDERIPEKNGDYRVLAVEKNYTFSGGYKQKLKLGLKIS